jgi:hypothetical protein
MLMGEASALPDLLEPDGSVEAGRLSEALRVTKAELARATGLSRDALSKTKRLHAPATQARLRDVVEIINQVLPWCGSLLMAFAWYRSQPIPAFGGQTAEDLVRAGRAEHLREYLNGIALGGYA